MCVHVHVSDKKHQNQMLLFFHSVVMITILTELLIMRVKPENRLIIALVWLIQIRQTMIEMVLVMFVITVRLLVIRVKMRVLARV